LNNSFIISSPPSLAVMISKWVKNLHLTKLAKNPKVAPNKKDRQIEEIMLK